jgi:RNA polymerase sporulation-specific sigma factor
MDVNLKHASHSYLDDPEVKRLIALSQTGDHIARDTLVNCNIRLVWSVVQRFLNRGYDTEDLFQIGCIGLLKSVDKFDLSYDVKFSTYAVPMIIGEIQRFLRDDVRPFANNQRSGRVSGDYTRGSCFCPGCEQTAYLNS